MSVYRSHFDESPLLQVEKLNKHFGGIKALNNFNINILPGEIIGLIGPNGAGKTTVFNLLSGVLKPTSGRILLEGRDITHCRPDQNARLGIVRTFQNIRLFDALSVIDNIKTAFHARLGKRLLATLFHTPGFRRSEREMTERSLELIELFGLEDYGQEPAEKLPYGIQRRVEIARALAASPSLLLLDEPSAGMNPTETAELIRTVRRIHEQYRLTLLLIEHDMKLVMELCRRIQVIDRGKMLAMGKPEEIRNDKRVIEAYMGKKHGETGA